MLKTMFSLCPSSRCTIRGNSSGKKMILYFMVSLLVVPVLNAGDFKIAFVDVGRIYNELTEVAEVEQQFQQKVNEWNKELAEKENEVALLEEEYANLPPIVTDKVKKEKQDLIQQKKRELYKLHNELINRADEKQLELMEPISKKVRETINTIAEEQGFDMVLNSPQGTVVVYAKNEEMDITDLVLQKLKESTE